MNENKEHLEFARAALASQDRTLSALRDLQAQVEGLGEYVETVKAERDAARAEVERLRGALAFYADGIAWDGWKFACPDDGTVARAALESDR